MLSDPGNPQSGSSQFVIYTGTPLSTLDRSPAGERAYALRPLLRTSVEAPRASCAGHRTGEARCERLDPTDSPTTPCRRPCGSGPGNGHGVRRQRGSSPRTDRGFWLEERADCPARLVLLLRDGSADPAFRSLGRLGKVLRVEPEHVTGGRDRVNCVLGTLTRGSWTGHRGFVGVGGSFAQDQAVALSTSAILGSAGGKLSVVCKADHPQSSVHWLKIMAMRVGMLTRINLDNGTKTTVGSGTPVAIIASRNSMLDLPRDMPQTVGQYQAACRQMVGADELHPRDPRPGFSGSTYTDCKLDIGGNRRDIDLLAAITSVDRWRSWTACRQRPEFVDAAVNCTGKSTHPTSISDNVARPITAGITIAGWSIYDSEPHAHTASELPTSPRRVRSYDRGSRVAHEYAMNMTHGFIDVGAGKWVAFDKAEFQGEEAACQLETASDFDRSEEHPWGDVAAQVVHVATSGETFRFRCVAAGATSSNPAQFRAIQLTALRLGSIQNVAMSIARVVTGTGEQSGYYARSRFASTIMSFLLTKSSNELGAQHALEHRAEIRAVLAAPRQDDEMRIKFDRRRRRAVSLVAEATRSSRRFGRVSARSRYPARTRT